MIKLLAGVCAFFSMSHCVLAWNAEGHMVVAQIAYNHLDAAVKAKCDALIAVPLTYGSSANNTFVTAACWADDYKSSLGTAIWHYIDLPFSLDGTSTAGVGTASFDVVQAINQCIFTLGSSTAAQTNQATSLRYLLHFMGDIQQPLHSSTAVSASHPGGDAGGNGFSLMGTWGNLHSLWDAGGGFLSDSLSRPLTANNQTTVDAKISVIETAYPYSANSGTIPNPMDWAQEGMGLAQTVSYVGITNNTTPSSGSLSNAQATAKQRMAAGGHRLADLLNTLFATNRVALVSLPPTNGGFGFSWSAIPGRTYRVQWKLQLSDPAWNDVANVVAYSSSASFNEELRQAQRFYQVVQ
jgi:hypothetical protein